MTLPLHDITVLDLADEPLALAGRLLADLGAAVVRAEDSAGDALRRRGPFLDGVPDPERGLAHLLYNGGKRSLALALDRPEAWDLLDRLAARADVVLAPLTKGPLAARFFTEPRFRAAAPEAGVVDAVFRRGSADAAVTDLIGTAAGGLLALNGEPADPPNHPAGNLAYKQTSLAAACAAVSLVLARGRGERGGWVTVSMQEAVMGTTIQSANQNYWHWHRHRPGRQGIEGLGGRTVFETADGGWVSFYYQHPPAWAPFVRWVTEALGDTTLAAPEWDDPLYRYQQRHQAAGVVAALCRTLPRDALVAEAQRRGILVVPVQGVRDIAEDPHLRARGFFQAVHQAGP
ncbi:MAG TPA: CoA transferase, partial [Dehalococcoidia bacterium]